MVSNKSSSHITLMFKDRVDAGQQLAATLRNYNLKDPIIYTIPRGGVVCAYEIARKLKAPLSLIITRKIGHPDNPEYAIGAVAEDGCIELTAEGRAVDQTWLQHKIEAERREAERRQKAYLAGKPPLSATGKTAVIVDDGLATGLTMLVAIKEVRHMNPERIVVAVPVAAVDTVHRLSKDVDEIIALQTPPDFYSIGAHYESFLQVSDEEVVAIIKKANKKGGEK